MPKSGIISDNPLLHMFDSDKFRERAIKPIQERIDARKDRLEITNEKANALQKLDGLVTNFKATLGDLINPIIGPFNATTTAVTTGDIGKAEDFLEVTTKSGVAKREYAVEVRQLARPANVVFNVNGAVTDFTTNAPYLNGDLTIALGGVNVLVQFDGTEANISEVISKINTVLQQNGDEFEAFSLKTGANSSRIEIKAREGVTKNIAINTIAYNNNGGVNITSKNTTAFQQAQIQIDGQNFFSDSNKFENVIDGVTFNAKKVNQNGITQTVKTGVSDPVNFDKQFRTKLAPAFNALAAFIQEQKSGVFNPEKPDERPPLAGESIILGQASDVLAKFVGSEQAGVLVSMGIGFQTSADPDLPKGTKLIDIVDEHRYNEALKDLDSIKEKLVTTTKITAGLNVTNSYLHRPGTLHEPKESFPAVYSGQNFNVAVTLDGASAVTAVVLTMGNGDVINGVYDAPSNKITFAGTAIEGLVLHFEPRGDNTITVNFTVNHTEGLGNRVIKDVNNLHNDTDGGSISLAVKRVELESESKSKELNKLETEFEAYKTKLDQQFAQIDSIAIMNQIMSDAMVDLLGGG